MIQAADCKYATIIEGTTTSGYIKVLPVGKASSHAPGWSDGVMLSFETCILSF